MIEEIIKNVGNSTIVAATKYVDVSQMKEIYAKGITNFGENRVDSFLGKYDVLNGYDITWHFIGHLQRNKCSKVINKIEYLHSLDNIELAKLINKYRTTPLKCFVQVNISQDELKYGINEEDLSSFLEEVKQYEKVEIVGLMTILKADLSEEENYAYFSHLAELCEKYNLKMTSMGMSSDYKQAVKANATYIRLGSILFKGE